MVHSIQGSNARHRTTEQRPVADIQGVNVAGASRLVDADWPVLQGQRAPVNRACSVDLGRIIERTERLNVSSVAGSIHSQQRTGVIPKPIRQCVDLRLVYPAFSVEMTQLLTPVPSECVVVGTVLHGPAMLFSNGTIHRWFILNNLVNDTTAKDDVRPGDLPIDKPVSRLHTPVDAPMDTDSSSSASSPTNALSQASTADDEAKTTAVEVAKSWIAKREDLKTKTIAPAKTGCTSGFQGLLKERKVANPLLLLPASASVRHALETVNAAMRGVKTFQCKETYSTEDVTVTPGSNATKPGKPILVPGGYRRSPDKAYDLADIPLGIGATPRASATRTESGDHDARALLGHVSFLEHSVLHIMRAVQRACESKETSDLKNSYDAILPSLHTGFSRCATLAAKSVGNSTLTLRERPNQNLGVTAAESLRIRPLERNSMESLEESLIEKANEQARKDKTDLILLDKVRQKVSSQHSKGKGSKKSKSAKHASKATSSAQQMHVVQGKPAFKKRNSKNHKGGKQGGKPKGPYKGKNPRQT
jgi:hypothetical protein